MAMASECALPGHMVEMVPHKPKRCGVCSEFVVCSV